MELFYNPTQALIQWPNITPDQVETLHVSHIGCHAVCIFDPPKEGDGTLMRPGLVDIYEVPRDMTLIKFHSIVRTVAAGNSGKKPVLSIRLPTPRNTYEYGEFASRDSGTSWMLFAGNLVLRVNRGSITTEARRKCVYVSFTAAPKPAFGGSYNQEEIREVIQQIMVLAKLNYTIKPHRIHCGFAPHNEWEFSVCPYTSLNTDLSISEMEIVSLLNTLDQIKLDAALQEKLNIYDVMYSTDGSCDPLFSYKESDFHEE